MNTEQGFKEFTEKMKLVLDLNQEKKGDSWVDCELQFLDDKLDEEYNEFKEETKPLAKAEECADMANVCMMLYNRYMDIWVEKTAKFLES